MTAALTVGPSAGVTGNASTAKWPDEIIRDYGDLARAVIGARRHPRAGHDRARWDTVNWDDYRAHVGICQSRGPWSIEMVEEKPATPGQWICEAEALPWRAGWYTALVHADRGLVMSDVPAEIAGSLPFLDRAVTTECSSVLITGLGLGIVPAWLLTRAQVERVDVIEIEADVIALVTGDECARETWAADPRLHVHHGDAHTHRLGVRFGCALHDDCLPPVWHAAAWHDIWDMPSARNLPSMMRLHRRFGHRTGWQLSWERPECEAMKRRGPVGCLTLDDITALEAAL
jgi:hypothetical protein